MDDFKEFWYWVREDPHRIIRLTVLMLAVLVGICVISAAVVVPLLVMQ